jgi:predicted dehydrogenase
VAHVTLYGLAHPHANAHLKTLGLSDQVDKLTVFDPDAELVAKARAEYPKVADGCSDLDKAIAGGPDVGVTCFTNDLNADLCVRLLNAGIHVISEKPIGATAAEVRRAVDAASAKKLRLGVMYQNRCHPLSQEARRVVLSGEIGRVTGCEARLITSQVQFRNPDHWLFKKEIAGGGILSWLGCHYLDLLRYVTDDEITDVSAMVATLSGEAIDVEDVATLSLRFSSGFLGSLHAGYQLALSQSGYMGPNYETYISIRGTEGRVVWEPSGSESKLLVESTRQSSAPSREVSFSLPSVDAYGGAYGLAFVDQFIVSTQSAEVEPPATGLDALRIAEVIEGAYDSSETGQQVSLVS